MKRVCAIAMVAVLVACTGAYLTAPSGSTIELVANPTFIASHGGVSELSAIVTEPAGTDVADGTVVLWTTTLGRVDPETRTRNGIARNRLVSDSRSGTAVVTVVSGGEAVAPSPAPTASPTTSPTTTTTPTTTLLRSTAAGGAAVIAALQNSDSIEITIGNVLVRDVLIRANPTRITNSSSTHVIATVLDANGNPVPNVPVFFEVIGASQDTEFFDHAGAPIHTNNNGEAEDVLRTRRTTTGAARVRAVAAAGGGFLASDDFLIEIL
jgi:hypothetical protein